MSALLSARGLTVGYGTEVPVISGLDLDVDSGEVVAILGANGAGKTTTLMALVGILPPVSGVISFAGHTRRDPLHRRVRDGLAFVADDRSVFMRLTVSENMRVAGVEPKLALEYFPELGEHLRRPVGLLSGGQQQMLSVGMALARKPTLLVADELSLGLAPLVVDRLLATLRDAASDGVAVLLVEQHVRKVLNWADRAYVMRRGEIVRQGPADELRRDIAEIERVYLSGAEVDAPELAVPTR